jgi:hypothetical protein
VSGLVDIAACRRHCNSSERYESFGGRCIGRD